jgi:hypothetical protein
MHTDKALPLTRVDRLPFPRPRPQSEGSRNCIGGLEQAADSAHFFYELVESGHHEFTDRAIRSIVQSRRKCGGRGRIKTSAGRNSVVRFWQFSSSSSFFSAVASSCRGPKGR